MTEQTDKPIIFELDKYSLFTPVEGNRRAVLSFSLRDGFPRVTVFTHIQSDNDGKGIINIAFDLSHFLVFLSRLEKVARSDELNKKEKATVKYFPRDREGRITGNPEPASELWFGKNEHGIIWLSVVQPKRPKIVFDIVMSDFHEFHNSKGESFTKAEGSLAITLAMISVLRYHFIERAVSFRDTSVPRQQKFIPSMRTDKSSSKQTGTPSIDDIDIDTDIPY